MKLLQRNLRFNLVSTVEHVDEDGQKHIVVAGGVNLLYVDDKTMIGCTSSPVPALAPTKK